MKCFSYVTSIHLITQLMKQAIQSTEMMNGILTLRTDSYTKHLKKTPHSPSLTINCLRFAMINEK